jgi:DNA processing protein
MRLQLSPLSARDRESALAVAGAFEALADGDPFTLRRRGLPAPAADLLATVTDASLDREQESAARLGVRLVARTDVTFPALLREIPDAPCLLWVAGALPVEEIPAVAVVGARRPTAYGLAMARRIAGDLSQLGVLIVSGGARGVDGAAHGSALDAGTPTVAVLGCGVDVAYPRENRPLFARIARAGALVSEYPCGTPPLPHHFPARNRILAGWAHAVVVVEASMKSGSLITARLAGTVGREVLAVPGAVTSRLSEGANALIAEGAGVARRAEDVIGALRDEVQEVVLERVRARAASTAVAAGGEPILDALCAGASLTIDEIAVATGLPADAILVRLVQLEAAGLTVRAWGGRHARA